MLSQREKKVAWRENSGKKESVLGQEEYFLRYVNRVRDILHTGCDYVKTLSLIDRYVPWHPGDYSDRGTAMSAVPLLPRDLLACVSV